MRNAARTRETRMNALPRRFAMRAAAVAVRGALVASIAAGGAYAAEPDDMVRALSDEIVSRLTGCST